MLGEKHISKLLRYAHQDLPSLENKIRNLTSEILDLGFKKKDLNEIKNAIVIVVLLIMNLSNLR